jgi:hypothetical protein
MSWAYVVMAAATVYSAQSSRVSNDRARRQQAAIAKSQQQAADQANNKANAKSPDVSAMLSAAGRASGGGQAGTLLTGSQGLDLSRLTLGKATLLGGGG